MGTFSSAFTNLIQAIGSIYLSIIMLRFLLQLARADFYNPISQLTVKLTQPILRPLQRLIPPFGRVDLAILVLAMIVQLVVIQLTVLINGGSLGVIASLAWGSLGLASLIINLYFIAILIMVVFSWIAPMSRHPGILLVHQILEPAIGPFRRIIPPIGGLDLSPMAVILIIYFLRDLLYGMANQIHPQLIAVVLGI